MRRAVIAISAVVVVASAIAFLAGAYVQAVRVLLGDAPTMYADRIAAWDDLLADSEDDWGMSPTQDWIGFTETGLRMGPPSHPLMVCVGVVAVPIEDAYPCAEKTNGWREDAECVVTPDVHPVRGWACSDPTAIGFSPGIYFHEWADFPSRRGAIGRVGHYPNFDAPVQPVDVNALIEGRGQ